MCSSSPCLEFPHIFVWGPCSPTSLCVVLAFDSVSRLLRLLLLRRLRLHYVTHHLSHSIFLTPSFSHHLTHTTLSHTVSLTQLCLTPSFSHHVTHTTLSHTIFLTPFSHTISLTQLCHTPSFTRNFVTHRLTHATLSDTIFLTPCHSHNFVSHHLSHTIFSHHLTHTTLSHTIFHTQLCHPHHLSHTTLSPTIFNFVTHHLSPTTLFHPQLCHTPSTLSHTIFHTQLCHPQLCHTHTQLCHTPSFTNNFPRYFAWQACHLTLRGRRATWLHPPWFRVAGVALGALGSGGALWSPGAPRHFAWQGVALGDIHIRFAWQAWHLVTSTFVSCGTRGTRGTGLCLVARLSLCALWSPGAPRHFAKQAWHLATFTFVLRGSLLW